MNTLNAKKLTSLVVLACTISMSACSGMSTRDKATAALNKGVALMVTEFGTTDASGDGAVNKTETATWWKFLDDNNLSWCNWSVADKVEASAVLKPGASATGGWSETQLTESGLFVRKEIKDKNFVFK